MANPNQLGAQRESLPLLMQADARPCMCMYTLSLSLPAQVLTHVWPTLASLSSLTPIVFHFLLTI